MQERQNYDGVQSADVNFVTPAEDEEKIDESLALFAVYRGSRHPTGVLDTCFVATREREHACHNESEGSGRRLALMLSAFGQGFLQQHDWSVTIFALRWPWSFASLFFEWMY